MNKYTASYPARITNHTPIPNTQTPEREVVNSKDDRKQERDSVTSVFRLEVFFHESSTSLKTI
jgi:hypothetical protein